MYSDKPLNFHINDDNELKPCEATIRACHYKKHYRIWEETTQTVKDWETKIEQLFDPYLPHPETLYHGSPNEIKPGGIIQPHPRKRIAFATGQINTAKAFAKHPHGRIYLVEPVAKSDVFLTTRRMKHAPYGTMETVSEAGFRVLAEVAHYDKEGKRVHKTLFQKCKICNKES